MNGKRARWIRQAVANAPYAALDRNWRPVSDKTEARRIRRAYTRSGRK